MRRAGRSEPVVMTAMEHPGQWAGGFRAWADAAATWRPAAARSPGRMLRVPATALARLAGELVPLRRAPDRGLLPDGAQHGARSRGSARRWSRSARWPPASPTRSTTRRRPRRGPSTRSRRRATRCCRRSCGSPSAPCRPSSSSPSTRCAASSTGPRPCATRSRSPTRRRRCPTGSTPTASASAWRIAPALAAAGVDVGVVRARRRDPRRRPRARPRVGGSDLREPSAARRDEGVDQPRLRARRRGEVVLAARPRVAADGRRHRGHREHAGDARAQARRRHRRARATPPMLPQSTRAPAS